jgi:hypothetical protein
MAQPPPTCPSNGSSRIKNHYAQGCINHKSIGGFMYKSLRATLTGCKAVSRIRDVYPGTDFFPSWILDPRSEFFPSRIRIKEFKYFNPKNGFKSLGIMIRVVHPGSRIQGSKRHQIPDPWDYAVFCGVMWFMIFFPSNKLNGP